MLDALSSAVGHDVRHDVRHDVHKGRAASAAHGVRSPDAFGSFVTVM